jgi:hypothetical protein
MRPEIGLTVALAKWAATAGFEITEKSSVDGRAILWNLGGEIRYFIVDEPDGWISVTSSERMGPEQFEFASGIAELVERKFIALFAALVRDQLGLPPVVLPAATNDIAAGYQLGRVTYAGRERCALLGASGRTLAAVAGGAMLGTANVAELSIYARCELKEITDSFMAPDGAPLFTVRSL